MNIKEAVALMGKSVAITGDHPYANAKGKAVSVESSFEGYGVVVEMDRRTSAVDELFITKSRHIKEKAANDYGKELILDLHDCNPDKFTRKDIRNYFKKLCKLIDMERCKLCWWDELYTPEAEKETEPHLAGSSAVQFIRTSNITVHALDMLHCVYINIFSCKDFDAPIAARFSEQWFEGKIVNSTIIRRV